MFKFIKNLSKKQITAPRIKTSVKIEQAYLDNFGQKEKVSVPDFYNSSVAEVISQNKKKATQLIKLGKHAEAIDLLHETISLASPFELRYDPDLIKKTANYMTAARNYVGCLNFLDKYAKEQFNQTKKINLIGLSSFIMPAFWGCCKSAGFGENDIFVLSSKLQILDLSNQGRFSHIRVRLEYVLEDKDVNIFLINMKAH